MILNVRGTMASGKTTLVRGLVECLHLNVPIMGDDWGEIGSSDQDDHIRVLGRYRSDASTMSGLDGDNILKRKDRGGGMDKVQEILIEWGQAHDVIFEGITISGGYTRWAKMCDEHPELDFVWAFIDTPLGTCQANMIKRRGNKPLRQPSIIEEKWKACRRFAKRAEEAGYRVTWLSYEHGVEDALDILLDRSQVYAKPEVSYT